MTTASLKKVEDSRPYADTGLRPSRESKDPDALIDPHRDGPAQKEQSGGAESSNSAQPAPPPRAVFLGSRRILPPFPHREQHSGRESPSQARAASPSGPMSDGSRSVAERGPRRVGVGGRVAIAGRGPSPSGRDRAWRRPARPSRQKKKPAGAGFLRSGDRRPISLASGRMHLERGRWWTSPPMTFRRSSGTLIQREHRASSFSLCFSSVSPSPWFPILRREIADARTSISVPILVAPFADSPQPGGPGAALVSGRAPRVSAVAPAVAVPDPSGRTSPGCREACGCVARRVTIGHDRLCEQVEKRKRLLII